MSADEKDLHDLKHYFALKLKAERQMTDVFRQVRDGKDAFVLLDTRSRNSFNKGHVPGALSVPENELAQHLGALDKNRTYVTYCYGET